MKARFWGTRGSIAKAGPGTVRYGGNTSCVEVRPQSGPLIVLDCGTGAHGLGAALVAEARGPLRGHLLVTHTHWDHIQGLPFFRPLFLPDGEWHVYGPRGLASTLQEALAGQMRYTYFPVALGQLAARVHYHDLVEGTFEIEGVRVTAQYLNHPALTLGYRLEADGATLVYATDHEPHRHRLGVEGYRPGEGEDDRHRRFISGADLLIHDAQYTAEEYPGRVGWGHGTAEYVVDAARQADVRRVVLFHHDPERDDASVERVLERSLERRGSTGPEVLAAAEGAVFDLGRRPPAPPPVEAGSPAIVGAAPLRATVLLGVGSDRPASVLEQAARADGLRLAKALRAEEWLDLVRSERPAVAFLGRGPALSDPLATVRELRARSGDGDAPLPVVVVVVDRDEDVEAGPGAEAGVTDWLAWPFSVQYARTRTRAWVLRRACRWLRAPLPADEPERLRALQALGLLDTPPEERFDRLTRLAAALFAVPIALVSLVDRDRQWFKSRQGLDLAETPREAAFCAHAILGPDVLLVPDAQADPRFADNPLVTGEPRVRFYAGVPLRLPDGSRAGTLCLNDTRPRDLDEKQIGLLRDLGALVERELAASGAGH